MGKVTQEFGEVLAEQPGTGRLSQVQGEVLGTPIAQGRLSQVQGEVLGTPVAQGRLSNILGEVLWPFLYPVASVPDITGLRNIPATFDSSASTGGYGNGASLTSTKLWSWTSVPGGSTVANISPTPMPDSGGTTFIAMTSNSVLYHCEGDGTDSSGNGNTATFSNVTTGAVGKVGSFAWSFDTTAGRAITTTNLDCTGDYTFAFWFHTLGADGGFRSALHSAAGTFIIPIVDSSNVLGLWNGSFQSSGFQMLAANYTGWHHMAIVATGAATAFYVNGVLVGTVPVKLTNAMKYIGNQNGQSQRFALRMDEISFWTRILSSSEISTLHVNQIGGYAGSGTLFQFTPDIVGVYTVQFSLRDSLREVSFPIVTDSANAVISAISDLGVWPLERHAHPPGIQGGVLRRRRGQM